MTQAVGVRTSRRRCSEVTLRPPCMKTAAQKMCECGHVCNTAHCTIIQTMHAHTYTTALHHAFPKGILCRHGPLSFGLHAAKLPEQTGMLVRIQIRHCYIQCSHYKLHTCKLWAGALGNVLEVQSITCMAANRSNFECP